MLSVYSVSELVIVFIVITLLLIGSYTIVKFVSRFVNNKISIFNSNNQILLINTINELIEKSNFNINSYSNDNVIYSNNINIYFLVDFYNARINLNSAFIKCNLIANKSIRTQIQNNINEMLEQLIEFENKYILNNKPE